ncbi:MAG TPA: hypothetical protein DEQ38_04965 [Elusimicrobia bacterium]|nr:MAG: hypothetical protein A2089_00925 [Elusimicrobia bacterium GWD2_63_28]HCC47453.1 hypothetical protein [Elusimicrobiota bacterium]
MEFFQAHPIAIFLGSAAVIIALALYFKWRRKKDLEQLAVSMGLLFSPEGPWPHELEATGLELFRMGRSRKATNLIKFSASGGNISVFDYRYTTGSGKNSHSHTFTLALIEGVRPQVPQFELKPESFIYKIGEAIGFKDIDLPAFPEFSDKYRLTGPDEAAVHMFFTPNRAAWFERTPGLRVQGAPGHVVFFKRDGQLPVNAWQGFIEEAKAFAAEVLR